MSLPSFVGIRIIGAGTGPRSVTFDYAAKPDAFFTAVDTGASLPPTAVVRFDDVELHVTGRGMWRLEVVAAPFAYTGPGAPAGLALTDVEVVRSGPNDAVRWPGNSGHYDTAWTLSTTATEIARSPRNTAGWQSLGFSGWDYHLSVDGDEAPGTYTTVVTYSLTVP